jgi:hypothetical protein
MADETERGAKARRFLDWLASAGGRDDSGLSLVELAELAAAYAEQAFERAGGEARAAVLDCRRGCAFCCHLPVETTAAEAARGLEYARTHLDDAGFAALVARIESADTAYPLSPDQPPARHPPCPFLIDDACLVYAVRPLACRGWNSTDVAACESAYLEGITAVTVPVDTRIRSVYANASEALARGLVQSGRDGPCHLVPALKKILSA